MFAGPLEITIDQAVAYWVADRKGEPLGPESDRSLEPCALVLRLVGAGADPDELVLTARLDDGQVTDVGSGLNLVDLAEAAAGIPARPRVIKE
jgi:hypothetical protein